MAAETTYQLLMLRNLIAARRMLPLDFFIIFFSFFGVNITYYNKII